MSSVPAFSLEYKQKPVEPNVCKRKHKWGALGTGDRSMFSTACLREIMVVQSTQHIHTNTHSSTCAWLHTHTDTHYHSLSSAKAPLSLLRGPWYITSFDHLNISQDTSERQCSTRIITTWEQAAAEEQSVCVCVCVCPREHPWTSMSCISACKCLCVQLCKLVCM